MNYLPPETQAELRQKMISDEISAIRLEENAARGKGLFEKTLAVIGEWMIMRGEKLRKRHSLQQANYSKLNKKAV